MKFLFYCILLILLWEFSVSAQYPEIFNHLVVHTPYRFRSNKHDAVVEYPNCKPKKIWMMIRHGTRYPKPKKVTAMETVLRDLKYDILLQHQLGKGNLSKDCIASLEDWSPNVTTEEDMSLTHEGKKEMIHLAERMKRRFPKIFKQQDNQTYLFRHTARKRTLQSAKYFAKGLFNKKKADEMTFPPSSRVDTVLRFYKHCDKWLKQVKKNPDTYKECVSFGTSELMNKTVNSVSSKLGLAKPLTLDQLKLMYVTCGYETAWNKHYVSPWCTMFDKESAEVLEYLYDLKYYWADGYGKNLTYRQACVAIKDMFESFSHDEDPKVSLLFAHSGTLLKILAHLGLYKPERHLTADEVPADRPWKTSNIDCFASNLAFVLFGCKDGEHVLAMHQEHVTRLPACAAELCPLDNLTRHYRDSILNCDFTDMCSLTKKEEL